MHPILSLRDIIIQQGTSFCLTVEHLDLLPHRIYALTGANGAGKSTLLRLLAFLTVPRQGTVSLNGGQQDLSRQRQKVTLVEQSPFMLRGTVADNLAYGLKLRGLRGRDLENRIQSALELVGLEGFSKRPADRLSGGEKQRVALARALALKPEVILLDEPTSNIDNDSLASFEALLKALPGTGTTVILATHDLTQPKRLGAEIIRIEQGRLLSCPQTTGRLDSHKPMERQKWLKASNMHAL